MSNRTARIEIHPATYRDSWNKVDVPRQRHLAPSQRPHFLRLVAGNGETLAHSETYTTRSNARRAVKGWVAAFESITHQPTPPVVECDASGSPR